MAENPSLKYCVRAYTKRSILLFQTELFERDKAFAFAEALHSSTQIIVTWDFLAIVDQNNRVVKNY